MNSIEKWKVMLCLGNSELGEVEIKRGIFQGYSLSPLVFLLALIPLSLILRKVKTAYEFSESKEKINHLLFMDDLKLYSRSEKGFDSLVQIVRVFSEGIGNGVWYRKGFRNFRGRYIVRSEDEVECFKGIY